MSRSSPASGMPRAASASIGPLASCSTLGRAGSASQAAEGLLVRRVEPRRSSTYAAPSSVAKASAVHVAGAGAPVPDRVHADPAAGAGVLGQPAAPARRCRAPASLTSKPDSSTASSSVGIASSSRSRSTRNSSPSKSVCTACRSHGWPRRGPSGPTSSSRSQTSALSRRLRITSPRCSRSASPFLPVISSACAITLSRPSYWLIHLAAKPWPTPGHARQVVGGLPHERGELGVARRRHAVALLDRGRRHPLHLRDAAHRVDHRRVVVDELEGVAVAGADQRLEPGGLGLRRQRADDVVGLVALLLEEGDPHRGRAPPRSAAAGC